MLPLAWYAVAALNVVTLLVFGFDKWRSRGAGRRVPERVLLWHVFLCGAPGAWLAISLFRHKTRKQPFRSLALLWTIVNPIWALLWWTWRELG